MTKTNIASVRQFAIEIAKEAGEIVKKYHNQLGFEISSSSKGGADFVTEADLAVDSLFRKRFAKKYPDLLLLTEETAPKDYKLLQDKDELLVLDPIDGTSNFSRKDKHIAISVGLVRKGISVMGVVYLPLEDDGKLYTSDIESEGATCNGEPIHVSKTNELLSASVGTDWSWDMDARIRTLRMLEKYVTNIRQPRCLGSAASDLCKVADGTLDVYLVDGIKPWDVAGAAVIVERAGGILARIDGTPSNVFNSDIFASNMTLHKSFLELISK